MLREDKTGGGQSRRNRSIFRTNANTVVNKKHNANFSQAGRSMGVPFSLFSSHRQFDDEDMTVCGMVIDCGNGIIKKDPDAERDVCNEDLGTDENTEGNIHDQEDSTSEEFEAEENVGEDIRSDLDEQGNAISEETKKVTEANIKNDTDEETGFI